VPKFLDVTDKAAARDALQVSPTLYYIDNYGADPTGVSSSDAAVVAAKAAMGSSPGTLVFGPGNYVVSTTINLGPYQGIQGESRGATVLKYTGSGDCIRVRDTAAYISSTEHDPGGSGGPRWAGKFLDFSIDGTGASGNNTCGIHMGDIARPEMNVAVLNFTGSNSKGIWFQNELTWTEKIKCKADVLNCTTCVVFESDQDLWYTASYGYADINLHLICYANQTGVLVTEGSLLYNLMGSGLVITGGFFNGTSTGSNTGKVLHLTNNGRIDGFGCIGVEAGTASGSHPGHQTIVRTGTSFIKFHGVASFFGTFSNGSGPANGIKLAGRVFVDNLLGKQDDWQAFRATGGITGSAGFINTSTGVWYPMTGNWVAATLAAGNTTMTIDYATTDFDPSFTQAATWDFFLTQPASGGPSTVTWPAGFTWAQGSAPTLSTTPGAVDWIRVSTHNFVNFRAHHVNGRTFSSASLSTPTLTSPRVNDIRDTNTNTIIAFTPVASAVNHVGIINATAGGSPRIVTAGSDTNIALSLFTKGTGALLVRHEAGPTAFQVNPVASGVNRVTVTGTTTGNAPSVSAAGDDINISLNLVAKGTGTVLITDGLRTSAITAAARLTNTAALDFGSVSAQSFADLTITVTGAATGDAVALGTPTEAVTAGIAYTAWVSATNTVTVRAHNYTAGALDPASGTFRATIIR
jgi:hypothetical protein